LSEAREFDLGDVLSVTTGCLVSPRHMAGIYDILNFMTGDDLMTHQIPRACRECEPVLLLQHPQLAGVDASGVTPANHEAWLAEQKRQFGERLSIEPCGPGVHERIDPLSELAEKIHPSKILEVRRPD
jgi:hypothetical protein